MKYKILISDNSFIIADENYILPLCFMLMKKPISIKDYLSNIHKYGKYYMVDIINGEWIRRTFTIEETDLNLPMNVRLKYSKDIQIGDLIEGPDGNPRIVNELHTGEDDMYEIEVAGETYTVNGGHILALVDKDTGEHLEMPVNVFMYMDDEFKSHWVMEKI
jgi:Hom_end-associated Hint.